MRQLRALDSAIRSGDITFGFNADKNYAFTYGTGSGAPTSSLTLDKRRFVLAGSTAQSAGVISINNNSSQALTINTDLLGTATVNRTLTLGGTGSGLSTFAGKISNGTIPTLNITKAGTGTWALSGTNSYTGLTNVSAGTLALTGTNSGNSNITLNNNVTLAFNSGAALGAGSLLGQNGGNANFGVGATFQSMGSSPITIGLRTTGSGNGIRTGSNLDVNIKFTGTAAMTWNPEFNMVHPTKGSLGMTQE